MVQKEKDDKKMKYLVFIILFFCLAVHLLRMINSPEKINLSSYETELISYFKEIALNAEFGESPKTIIKWDSKMSLYVLKNKECKEQVDKIEEVIGIINSIVEGSGFEIEITKNKSESNAILFLGNKSDMEKGYPLFFDGVSSNLAGLVDIEYDTQNFTIKQAKIFIDTNEPLDVQLSTIVEELTQSIGLPADSKRYSNSIFYEDQIYKLNKEYSQIDKDIIKLLYHSKMQPGLNTFQVDNVFKRILKLEPNNYFNG